MFSCLMYCLRLTRSKLTLVAIYFTSSRAQNKVPEPQPSINKTLPSHRIQTTAMNELHTSSNIDNNLS